MLVLRPLPSSLYLGHNYSLFAAIWRGIHSESRPIAPALCSRVSPFLAFYPRRVSWASWAGRALTNVTYSREDVGSRAREHIDATRRCHCVCRIAETFAANRGCPCEIILRRAKRELPRPRGSWTGSRSSIGNVLTRAGSSHRQTVDGFALDWKEIFRA